MSASRSVLITGASRGIGRATALAMASPEVRLVLAARSAEALETVAAQARAAGAEAIAAPGDITDEADVQRITALAAAATGHIDVVVNSVGTVCIGPFEKLSLDTWNELLHSQLTSLFLVCKHAAPLMVSGGLLINIGSVASRQAFPGWAAYTAAKHGALGFMAAIREELRPRGVRVTSVLPGATDTSLWDPVMGSEGRGNMLSPDEVAAAIATIATYPAHVSVEEITIGHAAGRL